MKKIGFTDYHYRAKDSIAQGALTNSKRPESLVQGCYPTHIKYGVGPYVYDDLNNEYVDFICGLGANLLGYSNLSIANDLKCQYMNGSIFSLGSTLEVEAAETVKAMFPFIDKLRFLKTGTEACMASLRIARAYHEINSGGMRSLVLSDAYHGWSDSFIGMHDNQLGCNKDSAIWPLKDNWDYIEQAGAVIVEPVILDASKDRKLELMELREQCTKHDTLLIFDEIITGFRFPNYSVSSYWGIEPDIVLFGKAFAAGLPLAIIGGKADVMECGEYFVSSTFAGDQMALRAFMSQRKMFIDNKFNLDDLWNRGRIFQERFNKIYPEKVKIEGYPTRGSFTGCLHARHLLFQEAALAGILLGPSFFFNFAHIGLEDGVLSSLTDILDRIKHNQVEAKGPAPKSPFAKKVRDNEKC
jgi:glutamate-1-semialdehyde aminotransferase